MTAPAIVMLLVSTLVLWGGLISSVVALMHAKPTEHEEAEKKLTQRDL